MFQSSCSELLVDTHLHDPEEAYRIISEMFEELGWESNPALSVELLQQIKDFYDSDDDDKWDNRPDVVVYDSEGNRAWIEYGGNGYIRTGFRFDSHCNDWDRWCFPIFKAAIDRLEAELISCDGGGTEGYERWERGEDEDE